MILFSPFLSPAVPFSPLRLNELSGHFPANVSSRKNEKSYLFYFRMRRKGGRVCELR